MALSLLSPSPSNSLAPSLSCSGASPFPFPSPTTSASSPSSLLLPRPHSLPPCSAVLAYPNTLKSLQYLNTPKAYFPLSFLNGLKSLKNLNSLNPKSPLTQIDDPPPRLGTVCSASSVGVLPFLSSAGSSLPQGATEEDAIYMRRAVELSRKALGRTSPNPMVGCVIVKDGEVVGEGFHPKAGEPHAEVFALREAGHAAAGATAYVSLEPCNHFGRTPPCSQALVKAKVKKVVVGTMDPNPKVAGKGIETLRKAGIEVVVGVEEQLCRVNVEAFVCRMLEKRPLAAVRYSMSLDGKALAGIGESGNVEGSYYSKLLSEYDAVVITDQALTSNPSVYSSEAGAKQPLRVVLAWSLDLPKDASIFDTSVAPTLVISDEKALSKDVERSSREGGDAAETWLRGKGVDIVIVDEIDLDNVLDMCYQRDASSLLWDAQGPLTASGESFLGKKTVDDGVVDKVIATILPVFVGGEEGGFRFELDGGSVRLDKVSTYMSGEDVVVQGYLKK